MIVKHSRSFQTPVGNYDYKYISRKAFSKAADVCGGDLMSNMRLQKMLYYEQGYHLAAFGTPLFDEDVEAWMYGPIVPSVYEHFKKYGAGGIMPETESPIELTEEEEDLFNDVFDAYVDFSTYGLMRKTHGESPWRKTTTGFGNVISHDKMVEFFGKKLADA